MLAAETLAEQGLHVGVETLRRWLTAEGLWQATPRRDTHSSRRPRRACFGGLIQLDASISAGCSRWLSPGLKVLDLGGQGQRTLCC